jgi:hypothetical protein
MNLWNLTGVSLKGKNRGCFNQDKVLRKLYNVKPRNLQFSSNNIRLVKSR